MGHEWTLSDFDYDLPEGRIAQQAIEPRDHSRLMVLHRDDQTIQHRHFYDLPCYLQKGDCLVLNDTRVLPARLYARRDPTGGKVEVLMIRALDTYRWEVMVRPGRGARVGQRLRFVGDVMATVVDIRETGERVLEFAADTRPHDLMHEAGRLPLPPYIHETLPDEERYQTVYARQEGSVAAPTAGLHFTEHLLDCIESTGVMITYVTLHVGPGTFRPVKTERIAEHTMHSEYYTLSQTAANTINQCREQGGRIVAVGTTATRTLETCATDDRRVRSGGGWTQLYIRPGYRYRLVDVLITNFHLPRSTLLMLVSAFAGYDFVRRAYDVGVEGDYRFYSLGDAMLIL